MDKIKKFMSDYYFHLDEKIIHMASFQEDKLILLVVNYLIIINVFEKRIIMKKKLKGKQDYFKIKTYDNNKIILFHKRRKKRFLIFEFIENNNNYYLLVKRIIKDNGFDIFFYKDNIITIEHASINVYTYSKNKLLQFQTKMNFNQMYQLIIHPNGKNLGIFHRNEEGEVFLSEINNYYKIFNTFNLKELKDKGLLEFKVNYNIIKSNNKTNNKFIISCAFSIFLFSCSDFNLIRKIEVFRGSGPVENMYITKSGDIYLNNYINFCKINIENFNDKKDFSLDNQRGRYFIFESGERKIIIKSIENDLYFYKITNFVKNNLAKYVNNFINYILSSDIFVY